MFAIYTMTMNLSKNVCLIREQIFYIFSETKNVYIIKKLKSFCNYIIELLFNNKSYKQAI